MNAKTLDITRLALLPAAMLTFASCSSTPFTPPIETTAATAYQEGVPGGLVVETHSMKATVIGIDAANRKVTLVTSDGKKTTVKCGPDVINFDQIRIGDQLKVTVAEEVVAYLAEAGASQREGGAAFVALAPKGAKPGGIVTETVQVTARVTAIDLKARRATLQFPDGAIRKVAVRPDVDLTKRHVGEEVVIRITEMVVLSVETPS
ncbi:MAG TPA: hypothetical protein P5205_02030 [Candidatus Paceibacterota bacterium]|nr:hypothetical protein [Verrucomicrobiota bacterium]HSA09125.1 hypothetical protein [Candidatus Paceibacterota bacterium]